MKRAAARTIGMLTGFGLILLAGCSARPVSVSPQALRIPRDAARFEIDSVTDSTAIFRLQEARWVRRGMLGYAVDPVQRDELVARVTVVSVDSTSAVAVVTSQTALVRTGHVLLVLRPERRWWHDRMLWTGVGTGAVLGAGAVLLTK